MQRIIYFEFKVYSPSLDGMQLVIFIMLYLEENCPMFHSGEALYNYSCAAPLHYKAWIIF